jgi:DNA-directed RNA polymerase II subunit RPB1
MEMNIFLPQSIQTQIELEEIVDVKRQIITPSRSTTIIGVSQDPLVGAYNMTSPNTKIDWRTAMNIMSYTGVEDFKYIKKDKEYNGHDLVSLIIPSKINLNRPNLEIENGKLKRGIITNEFLGAKKKSALHQLIWDEYGVEQTKDFLNNAGRLFNNFNLFFNGFTVGIGDIDVSLNIEKQINNIYNTKDIKISNMITELENNPELMEEDLYEKTIFSELNVIREDVSQLIMNNLPATNNFKIMASCGSKGSATNMGQMGGCVGLQAVEGKLIQKKINRRTLPYFFQNDDRSESRGLVKNSFLKGMTYPEFFYHTMAGREGCIDSTVKTAESGYIQRKLVKSLEDFMIKYDGTVRSATNNIIQFIYGDSGADTTKQFEFTMKIIDMGDTELSKKYKIKEEDLSKYDISKKDNESYYDMIREFRNKLRKNQIKTRMDYISIVQNFMIPINLTSIVENNKNDMKLKELDKKDKLTASYIIAKLDEIMNNNFTTLVCIPEQDRNNPESIKFQNEQYAKTSVKIAIHSMLAPARCFYEYDLSKAQFDNIIKQIIEGYNKNLAEAGEMVGTIAAQAMGEPVTQLTLNSLIEVSNN